MHVQDVSGPALISLRETVGSNQFSTCRVADAMTASRGSAAKPVALFVLGFGRSGTSALTRVLSLCGAALPAGLLGATSEDPRGCGEPRAAIHLNETILRRHGSSGYDLTLRMQEEGAFDADENAADIA